MVLIKEIQEKLSEAIKQSGVSQSEIARRLGISPTQISCYVHGTKLPALDTLANLCIILDIDPADILCTKKN